MATETFNYEDIGVKITKGSGNTLFIRIYDKYLPHNTLLCKPYSSISLKIDELENKLVVEDKY